VTAPQSKLAKRVAAAAEAELAAAHVVAPVDVLVRLGWLPPGVPQAWRQGRLPRLTDQAAVPLEKLITAVDELRAWAQSRDLQASETQYLSGGLDHRPLRFTADGGEAIERAFRVHWISPDLSPARREQLVARQNKAPDLVVVLPGQDWTCADCGDTGDMLVMEAEAPHCLACADLDHLVFLPSGNAALSRRAKQASGLAAVVVRYNRSRKRYERRGVLIEQAALEWAEEQCLADADLRERRRERDRDRRERGDVAFQAELAQRILRQFPGCPADRAQAIAEHAGRRGSGRVGRSAAARAFDEDAIRLAVHASIRHLDTDYDQLLMSGVPRTEARARIAATIERMAADWRELA
jgi:hypothetical protein